MMKKRFYKWVTALCLLMVPVGAGAQDGSTIYGANGTSPEWTDEFVEVDLDAHWDDPNVGTDEAYPDLIEDNFGIARPTVTPSGSPAYMPDGDAIGAALSNGLMPGFTTAPTAEAMISHEAAAAWMNPLTGLPVVDPALLEYPPMFIPLARYPSAFRPSAGHSTAQWVFELYVSDEESRPILMYYGALPASGEPEKEARIYPLSSAMFGLESLRRAYRGVIISTPPSRSVMDSEIYNMELWYGLSSMLNAYPELPLSNLRSIMDKWKAKATPPDVNNLRYSFSDVPPEGGVSGQSLFVRYAYQNRIIWQYDVMTNNYKRSQNSVESPLDIAADVDTNNTAQVAADNLVVIFVPHYPAKGVQPNTGYFDLDLLYTGNLPALIFRDGQMYEGQWSTVSESFEVDSNRLRPIRILDKEGMNFKLKPGLTWVHFVQPGNPYYEVNEPLGTVLQPGSGFWKLPYVTYTSKKPIGDWYDIPEFFGMEYSILQLGAQ